MASKAAKADESQSRNQFGAFGGVFTPSILTILGVIMFMRTGFVTGQAGILYAILILVFAKSITFLTGLSISAVSTNTEVKGGGAYFLISRSLGAEFGGSIGLTLYLAQAFSVPFYILGFVEAMVISFKDVEGAGPWIEDNALYIGLGTAILLFIVNYIGASWAIKAQYFILTVLGLAIVAFMGGALLDFDVVIFKANLDPLYTGPEYGFWVIFAIFFPAVTGIMAGVNMSGDLANPAKSIPRGTLMAILVGFVIYLIQILITGGAQDRLEMVDDPYGILLRQALFGLDFLVIGGVFAATISSALGSLMGAPRILQALARDNIFPALKPFGKGTDKGDEPRRGLWLTLGLTVAVLFAVGDVSSSGDALNLVASVLSMFFLYTYGMTNMAAFVESFSGNPSFRPRFRQFHWSTALLGAIGCFTATFLIDALAAVVSIAILAGIFVYVERRVLQTTFGDARRGFYYSRARKNIFRLAGQPPHAKNWRPTTLVLSGNPRTRLTLSTYAVWLESGRGITTLAEILVGDFHERVHQRREALEGLEAYIEEKNLQAFAEVLVAPSFDIGMASILQAHSIGPLKPNMVALGWGSVPERAVSMSRNMRLAAELGMSQVVLVDKGMPDKDKDKKRIDLWWRGQRNGSLMVILAYMLTLNYEWSGAELRLLRLVRDEEDQQDAHHELFELVEAARIDATIKVLVTTESFRDTLTKTSSDADLVLLGFAPPSDEDAPRFHAQYIDLLEPLPTTLLVSSSGDADLMA